MSRRTKIMLWIAAAILGALIALILWEALRPHPGMDGPYPIF
jgi:hypothetical protein